MPKPKKKTLPKDFEDFLQKYSPDEIKDVLKTRDVDAYDGYAKADCSHIQGFAGPSLSRGEEHHQSGETQIRQYLSLERTGDHLDRYQP